MTYTPVVPLGGYAGWKFLSRTMEKQQATFVASAEIQRNEEYFREKIGEVKTAKELVSDRRLLTVALGAFGLDDDINNKYFVQKVLEEGTLDSDALANKLSDKRYLALSKAFGFGDFNTPRTVLSDFPDEILANYETRQFEIAVGDVDTTMRMVMTAQREIPELAAKTNSETTKWYTVIGSPTMSEVFRVGLGLPQSVSALDVDQQVEIYRQKTDAMFGSTDPAIFTESASMDKLLKTYLLRSEVSVSNSSASNSIALQLLNSGRSSTNILSVLL
ncbi:flagellar protein [Rhodobacter xanthinilyticus]|uniref:Flagellar protein n=1 Tax=Rhodobacter xanthinilyticus TaxID=1850250 RepID=A0A1D9MFV5_9RHOB|nr:DUF1217 domain-containing protein [Rhodobacter xanthinilyticus]AOZ70765.1 flagellar protein [Rhodobacter xanthinilyticus]